MPKPVVALSTLLALASLGIVGYAIANDPLEYDFKKLKSDRGETTAARALNKRVGAIVGSANQGNGIAVVTPTVEDAIALEAELEGKEDNELWGDVYSIFDLLPEGQEAKVPLVVEIRELLQELRSYANDETREKLDEHMPPEEVAVLGLDDIPEKVARRFTERDGTRGRLVVVERLRGNSIWDGRYLMRWADALRELRLADGTRPPLAGRAPVFADIIRVIVRDGPKAILLSFIATLLLTLLTFRKMRERLLTMTALLVGILWMAAAMALAGMRLNFLNFVAFPITFGNGVDYGVNVMRRYDLEREGGNREAVFEAVRRTGGAVILCSLTTIIGYTSLYTSANQAINSFGAAMAISEITCLLSAVLTVPAILWLMDRREAAKPAEGAAGEA